MSAARSICETIRIDRGNAGRCAGRTVARDRSRDPRQKETSMTICPIAIAVGCKKCPVFAVCPVKSIIGDYNKEADSKAGSPSRKAKTGAKPSK
jgi:hypothetical protein